VRKPPALILDDRCHEGERCDRDRVLTLLRAELQFVELDGHEVDVVHLGEEHLVDAIELRDLFTVTHVEKMEKAATTWGRSRVDDLYSEQVSYATPKVDVRGAVLQGG